MGGLVGEIERKAFFVAIAILIEAEVLQTERTLLQPVVLGHAFNE